MYHPSFSGPAGIELIPQIQLANSCFGPIDLVPRTDGSRVVGEGKVGPISVIPGRPGHLDHLGQLLLRLVEGEDVFEIKVLGRHVEGVEVGLVQQLALRVGQGDVEAG